MFVLRVVNIKVDKLQTQEACGDNLMSDKHLTFKKLLEQGNRKSQFSDN